MILFSRVRGAFDKIEGREWALLTLETLGVIAGILIAFELNEWASRRAEAARHRQIMERLFEESQQDVASSREMRDIMLSMSRNEIQFSSDLSNSKCPSESQWRAVTTIQMLPSFDVPRSVYQELMGAGGLSSIKDTRVREAITIFNTQLDWAQGQNEYFRQFRPEVVPPSDSRITIRLDMKADDPEVVTFDRAALCRDPAFRNRMVDATRNHLVVADYHDGVTAWAINMCGVLGASLGHRCEPAFGGKLTGKDAELLAKAERKIRS